jgi:hypothetical protein
MDDNEDPGPLMLDLARAEHEHWLRTVDAQDAKAGIILGFSAALVAFGGPGDLQVGDYLGKLIAVVAAILAIVAIWPRNFAVPPASSCCRELNLATRNVHGRLIGTYLKAAEVNKTVVQDKQQMVNGAVIALLLAVLAFAVSATYTITTKGGSG